MAPTPSLNRTLTPTLTLTLTLTRLFVDAVKLPAEVHEALQACDVRCAPYEEAEEAVRTMREEGGKVLLDPALCNFGLRSAAAAAAVLAPSPVTQPVA